MTADEIRELERDSIRAFVESCTAHFTGMVLDYGSGLSPYRDVIKRAGGEYVAHDRIGYAANVSHEDVGSDDPLAGRYDAILCTQVLQYVEEPFELLLLFAASLVDGGHLVITGPESWPSIEGDDLFRYTQAGVEKLLRWAGFDVVRIVPRAGVSVAPGFDFSLGWGAVARA